MSDERFPGIRHPSAVKNKIIMLNLPVKGSNQILRTGVDFVPVLNTQLTRKGVAVDLVKLGALRQFPKAFSWHIPKDAGQKLHIEDVDLLLKPHDQKACGCCWVIAAVHVVADRLAVQKMQPASALSISSVLSCIHHSESDEYSSLGCGGGFIHEAFKYLENIGVAISNNCTSYSWCTRNSACNGLCLNKCSYDAMNAIIPPCSTCMREIKIKALPHSTYYVGSEGSPQQNIQMSIQSSIYDEGPVASGFMVYMDFVMGAVDEASMWPITNGVYIHGSYEYVDKATQLSADEVRVGGHAIVIVGWGEEILEQWEDPVPFFWIKNSWSSRWGLNGYCKIAMSDNERQINTQLGLDVPYYKKGGVITCQV